ncbi:hypothetical protein [Roseomonas fluvialis]|uniref:Uncharacterized protein n=1 Tax=Roseomonas fluvialis TaxID=1750527 RepID=A0ABN6P0T1_9PROT|nr:hypothetical protein [Roseomonas fluvialis]BDG71976.1 hypothetical protein Rmf_19050 [Roseomonas fluvialis]
MPDILDAMPPRHTDKRIGRLVRRFGVKTLFSISDAAQVLQIDDLRAWKLLYIGDLADSSYRVARNNGRLWCLQVNPFVPAAQAWASQYRSVMAALPPPFSADQFSKAAGIPFAAGNTILSVMAQYGHLVTGRLEEVGGNALYRLPPRKVIHAGHLEHA